MKLSIPRSIAGGVLLVLLTSCGGDIDPNQAVTPEPTPRDGGSSKERRMSALARGHPQQKRSTMIWDARLNAVARARAKDMGTRQYFGHVDPDGYGPNWHITKTGYRLPIRWTASDEGNQVESILAGHESVDAAFRMWMGSSKHITHILGHSDFYRNQTQFGAGYAFVPHSLYKHYWVFISAPPEN